MSPFPTIVIVILNWNNASDTIDCLDSLATLDYPNYRLLVVDNGSTDESVVQIRVRHPGMEILETGDNLGYAEGNNVGIRHAIQNGADYLLVLNNDTLVAPTMLTELVQFAEAHPQVGMVGPTMYCTDPADKLYAAGSFIDWAKGHTWHRGIYQPAAHYTHLNQPEPVDFITGCGVLVRRQLIEVAGVLDPIYFLNYEDVEWCVRARRHGFEVWYVPQAIMWHKDSATFEQGSPAHTYYLTRNRLLFFWQNTPKHLRWLVVSRLIFTILQTMIIWSLKSQYRSEFFQRKRQANLFALRDFFLGRFNKMGTDVSLICYPNHR